MGMPVIYATTLCRLYAVLVTSFKAGTEVPCSKIECGVAGLKSEGSDKPKEDDTLKGVHAVSSSL